MGLKSKIKDALHGDKEERPVEENSPTQAPGAYPTENDPRQGKTSEGEFGSSNQNAYEPASAGSGVTKHTATGRMAADSPISSGQHTADSGIGFDDRSRGKENLGDYSQSDRRSGSQEPYWGSMSEGQSQQGGPNVLKKDLPYRPNEQTSPTSTTGGTYNTIAGAGSRDYDSRDREFGGREFGSSTEYGTGREYGSGREFPSSTAAATTTGGTRYEQQQQPHAMTSSTTRDSRPYEAPRDRERERERAGLGAAGAAGLAGAGYAATRDSRDRERDYPSRDYDERPGVPKSNLVENREYDHTRSGAPQIPVSDPYQTRDSRDFDTQRRAGPHDSNMANKFDPRVDSDLDGSRGMPGSGVAGQGSFPQQSQRSPQQQQYGGMGMGAGMAAAGAGAGAGAASGMSSGLGKDHYGPAHEGAKVVHTCQNCGVDNDISQYFRKDAVYRMG